MANKDPLKTSLTLVGTGIKTLSHLNTETKTYIESADKVLFLLNEPILQEWVMKTNLNSESLEFLYWKYPQRRKACYQAITDYILEVLETQGGHITVVFYGHPTVFAQSGLDAVRIARTRGYDVRALPGISAEDCLFADLEIDPAEGGCQSFEATDFLIRTRPFDTASHLILWQVGSVGLLGHENEMRPDALQVLYHRLRTRYDDAHLITLYEGAQYPSFEAIIQKIPLKDLPQQQPSRITTLYIPPTHQRALDPQMLDALGILCPLGQPS